MWGEQPVTRWHHALHQWSGRGAVRSEPLADSGRFCFRLSPRPQPHRGNMKALNPAELTQTGRPLRLLRLAVPVFRPQPRKLPTGRFVSRLSATGCFRLRHERAGSPPLHAESGSSSYGLPAHLRLLPTPPHGDAVTFNYGAHDWLRHGLPPCKQSVLTERTRSRASGNPGISNACPDRGRENRLDSIPPPSEPDVRISRIRLSG